MITMAWAALQLAWKANPWAVVRTGLAGAAVAAILLWAMALKWDNHTLRADLAESQAALKVIEAGREAFRKQAESEVTRLAQRDAEVNRRGSAAERIVRNAPHQVITDADLATYDCLQRLRAQLPCTAAPGLDRAAAPATP